MSGRFAIGISIAGLGQRGVYPVASQRLRLSTTSRTVSGFVRYISALAAWPRAITTETEPLDGLTTQGSMEIVVDGLDRPDVTNRQVGHGVLDFFWSMRPQHDWVLTNRNIDSSQTIFGIEMVVGGQVPVAGDLIYVNREVMYVVSISFAPPYTIEAVRGVWGSATQAHDQRDPFGFTDKNPVTVDREVEAYLLDLSTSSPVETLFWRGVVESFEPIDSTTAISIKCRDMLGYLAERKLGVERFEAPIEIWWGSSGGADTLRIYPRGDDQLVGHKPLFAENTRLDGAIAGTMVTVMVEGIALLLKANFAGQKTADVPWAYRYDVIGGEAIEIDGQTLEFDKQGTAAIAREILIADADNEASMVRDAAGDRTDHPANIIRNILASTGTAEWQGAGHIVGANGDFDWLPKPWGLAVPDELIDHDAFDVLVDRWPTNELRARSFYLGADDQVPKAGEVLYDLAQACNAYLYLTPTALISIKALRDPGPNGIDAIIGPEDLAFEEGAELEIEQVPLEISPVYAVEIEIGQQGPGGAPVKNLSAGDLLQPSVYRYRHLARPDKVETTRIYGDPETYAVSSSLIHTLAAVFLWRYVYLLDTLPSYTMRTTSSATQVSAGQWISLNHPTFFDTDLSRGIISHRCLILSADFDTETQEQMVRVVDFFPVSGAENFVSPSWKIDSVASNTIFDILPDRYSDDDAAHWVNDVTYKYNLYDGHGALRSTVSSSAGTISTLTVTLAAAWSDGSPVTPAVGDIVRVEPYDASKAAASWTEDDFLWIADSAGFLGAANDAPSNWDV